MNEFESKWQRLVTAARQAPGAEDVASPYGFSTRVVTRAWSAERPALLAVFAPFSIRALWLASLLALASVATNYLAFANNDEDEQGLIDPVSEVLSTP